MPPLLYSMTMVTEIENIHFPLLTNNLCLFITALFLSLCKTADVRIGLLSDTYSASEGNVSANVTLELLGAAEREVSIVLQTEDGTALGTYIHV